MNGIKKFFTGIMIIDLLYIGAGIDSINDIKTFLICLIPAMVAVAVLGFILLVEATARSMIRAERRQRVQKRLRARKYQDIAA